ncbi:MAG: IS110 family transposase [Nocardioides sp.]
MQHAVGHRLTDPTGPYFAGIDWGNSHHQLCVLDNNGIVLDQVKDDHDIAGIETLLARAGRNGKPAGIAIERSEGILVEALQAAGHRLFCVSPKMSARARERYRLAPTKSDAFDAYVLADSLRHEHRHWRPLATPSDLLAELRVLTRDRQRLIANQRDVENQLRAIVLAYHPAALHLFSSLDRDITLAFLRDYPTPAAVSRVGNARMAGFCGRHGYSGRTPAGTLVDRLRPHLLSATPGTVAGKAYTAAMFVDQLGMLNQQVRSITKHIDERLASHPDAEIFLSFPAWAPSLGPPCLPRWARTGHAFPPRLLYSPRPVPHR